MSAKFFAARILSAIVQFLKSCYERNDLLILFVLALVLRLALLWESAHQIGLEGMAAAFPDARNYLAVTHSIIAGTGEAELPLVVYGPGNPYYLALLMSVLGNHYLPLFLANILLSSISCLLIYKLAMILTNSRATGLVAGVIAATSYTSINLSCTLLSDTLYFFLFLTSLIAFLRALHGGRWLWYILTGLLIGLATLTRSVGQFWPIVMIVLAVVCWRYRPRFRPVLSRRGYAARLLVMGLIFCTLIGAWVGRNYSKHGIPMLTMASTYGINKLASLTVERLEDLPYMSVRERWVEEHQQSLGKTTLTPAERYSLFRLRAYEVWELYPREMIKTYLHWTWRNLTAISRSHRLLMPEFSRTMIPWERTITGWKLNYICLVLSIIGMALLLTRREYWTAVILGAVYLYYIPLIGFTAGQGARIFFPAQISWAILIGIVLVSLGQATGRLYNRLRARAGGNHQA